MDNSVTIHAESAINKYLPYSMVGKNQPDVLTRYGVPRHLLASFLDVESVAALCRINRKWSTHNLYRGKQLDGQSHGMNPLVLSVFNQHRHAMQSTILNKLKECFSAQEISSLLILNYTYIPKKIISVPITLPNEGNSRSPLLNDFVLIPHLQTLTASLKNDEEYSLNFLNQVPFLKKLMLVNSPKITDSALENLRDLTHLQHLSISQTKITDKGLENLTFLINLKSLNVSYCEGITGEGLKSLSSLTTLQNLQLAHCARLTTDGAQALSSLTTLRSLNLSNCRQVIDIDFLKNHTLLESLDLSHCGELHDVDLSKLNNLIHINFNSCSKITGFTLQSLKGLTYLRHLDIGFCELIVDRDLENINKSIETLNIMYCLSLTNAGLESLKDYTNLVELKIHRDLTDENNSERVSTLIHLTKLKIKVS